MIAKQLRTTNAALEAELRNVAVEPKSALRERYVALFGRAPPKVFGPDLLRRSVAQQMQQNVYGGLSRAYQCELDRLVSAMIADPRKPLKVARRAQSGTVLARDWKGRSCRVVIVNDGFHYEGNTYSNLSEIARLITGTRWNGPRFFGLRPKHMENVASSIEAEFAVVRAKSKLNRQRRIRSGHGL
jgi:hypothetical protein